MRPGWFIALAAVCVTACTTTPPGPPTSTRSEPSASEGIHVTPSNIRRIGAEIPSGYEMADVTDGRAPAEYWGLGADWTTDPAQCAALANPVTGDATPQGVSGSGDAGIIYAVVSASASPLALDPVLVSDCPRWSMAGGRTTATVDLTPAPEIDGVATLAMTTAARTVVEGGTETDAQIDTVAAYLGDYLAFVVVVTDPGSPHPRLPDDFAATLLVKVVATLRG